MKLIALDVGSKRIGVAKADSSVRIAIPYGFFLVDGSELTKIASFARVYGTNLFVIGMPRNSEGQETAQSLYVRSFAKSLKEFLPDAKIHFQDESLTSVAAEQRLEARGKKYEKGDIDAEAAAIILQDFLENYTRSKSNNSTPDNSSSANTSAKPQNRHRNKNAARALPQKKHPVRNAFIATIIILLLAGGGCLLYGLSCLQAVDPDTTCPDNSTDANYTPVACQAISLEITDGQGVADIANSLANANLIRNPLVFQTYYHLNYSGQPLLAGDYELNQTMDVKTIIETLVSGSEADVFQFTIIPGETLADFQADLKEIGYTEDEINDALTATYDSPILEDKPDGTSLEGYLYGETYEFYQGASVQTIVQTALDQFAQVAEENDLKTTFAAQGLNLYEGITLASVVQQEAKSATDQATVAQVFYTRLAAGTPLGSDVTAKYAADLVDPYRTEYTTNSAVLNIDSPYNTRKYSGLPYGPICNPGEQALVATAHPADTDYLYFLTGDDGMMYYSKTGSEHEQNIAEHCQDLCNTQL